MKKTEEKGKKLSLMKETVVTLNSLKLSRVKGGDSIRKGKDEDTSNGGILGPPDLLIN